MIYGNKLNLRESTLNKKFYFIIHSDLVIMVFENVREGGSKKDMV